MSYFKDVYLKRVNRFGTTLQERIINKKEYDFHHFVERSPNKVKVFIKDLQFAGVLQTKTYNEIETIDYFLTYKTIPLKTGTILKIQEINHYDKYNYWIVIARDNFVSAGYFRYTVVKLDREIGWITDEGYLYKALVHVSGSGSGGTNRRLISATKITNESVVYMPNQVLTLVMQDAPEIKRGARITIKDIVWKISGYDNVTNDGVSYVTLEQDYTDEKLDNEEHLPLDDELSKEDGIADSEKMKEWTFHSTLLETVEGDNIVITIPKDTAQAVSFYASYYNKPSDYPLTVLVEDTNIVEYKDRTLKPKNIGETTIRVSLEKSPNFYKDFIVKVEEGSDDEFSIEGPARVKCGIPTTFSSNEEFEVVDIIAEVTPTEREKRQGMIVKEESLLPDRCVITPVIETETEKKKPWLQNYSCQITFFDIYNKVKMYFKDKATEEIQEVIIEVESPWIGG